MVYGVKVRMKDKVSMGRKCRMGGTEGIQFRDFGTCEGGEGVEALMVQCRAEVSLMRIAWFGVGLWR